MPTLTIVRNLRQVSETLQPSGQRFPQSERAVVVKSRRLLRIPVIHGTFPKTSHGGLVAPHVPEKLQRKKPGSADSLEALCAADLRTRDTRQLHCLDVQRFSERLQSLCELYPG
jgi:hypothetical protein